MRLIRNRSFQRAFFAAWAVLASSPVFYIVHAGYPFFSVIVLCLLLLPMPLAGFFGLLASAGRAGRTLSAYGIAATAVTIHSQWDGDVAVVGLYLAAAAFGVFVYYKGDKAVGFLAVIFAAIGLLSPLNTRPFFVEADEPSPDSDLPPLIHIVLDEHGPGGFEDFSHWPNAYARYYHTINSLSDMLDGYPEKLADLGYDVEVWQIDYPDLCYNRCATYDPASFRHLDRLPLVEQAAVMADMYLGSRYIARDLTFFPSRSSPINGLEAFRLFADRTARMRKGEAIIFHAMLPHGPWAFDEKCTLKPLSEWGNRMREPRDLRLPRYEEQRACTEILVRNSIRDDAIIILHGDHSNRIADRDPQAHLVDLTEQEIRHAFRTLFAMRFPGQVTSIQRDWVSVGSLLRDFGGRTLPEGGSETVWLEDIDWVPTLEIEMPAPEQTITISE